MILSDNKEKRLAKRKYFQMQKEYDRKKEELQRLYVDLLRQRTLAGLDSEVIQSPDIYEVPEYIHGRTIR